jgi:hypothetical protein
MLADKMSKTNKLQREEGKKEIEGKIRIYKRYMCA